MTASSTSDPARPTPAPSERAAAGLAPVAVAGTPVVLALFIVALALRPQLSAIGPLVPQVLAEFGPSHAFVGLLTAIPVCCMGLFALAGPPVAARFGTRGGVVLSVVVLVASGILRALVPGRGARPAGHLRDRRGHRRHRPDLRDVRPRPDADPAGRRHLVLCRRHDRRRRARCGARGAARDRARRLARGDARDLAALDPVPRRRGSSSSAAGPARTSRPPATRRLERPRLPIRRGVVWAIALLFGLQSWLYYGQTAWLASVYIELGWTPRRGRCLAVVVSVASLGAIVLAPAGAPRGLSRRVMLTAAAVSSTAGLAGGRARARRRPSCGRSCSAFGLGMMFTLLLTLPDRPQPRPARGGRRVGADAARRLPARGARAVRARRRARRDRRVRPGDLAAGRRSPSS